MKSDPLGDRMKSYESDVRFDGQKPIIARLDGKAFHSWTRGLERPFDGDLREAFRLTLLELMEGTGAVFGYTQSDELTLVFKAAGPNSQVFMGGRRDKMTSVLASMMTAEFNKQARAHIGRLAPALFDCRVYEVPDDEEAANVILWRWFDCRRNAISAVAQFMFSHRQLEGKSTRERHGMILDAGVAMEEFAPRNLYGIGAQKRKTVRRFTADEIDALPPKHEARSNPDLMVERNDVVEVSMERFNEKTNRVGIVLYGEEPTEEK